MNEPLEYQLQAFEGLAANTRVVLSARRIGVTWAAAHRVISGIKDGANVFYLTDDPGSAKHFVDCCLEIAKLKGIEQSAYPDLYEDQGTYHPCIRIPVPEGSIIVLWDAPSSLSNNAHLFIVDNAAWVEGFESLLRPDLPTVVLSCGSPDVSSFNRLVADIRSGRREGEVITITLRDAINGGLYKRICERRGLEASPEAQAQWERELRRIYGKDADLELDCVLGT